MRILALIFFLLVGQSLMAVQSAPTNVESELAVAKREVSDSEEKKRRLINAIVNLNVKIKHSAREESLVRQKKIAMEESIKVLNESIQNLQVEIKDKKSQIRRRLLYMSRNSGTHYLKSLILAENPSEFERKIRFLTAISKKDLAAISEYRGLLAELEAKQFKQISRIENLSRLEKQVGEQEQRLNQEIAVKQKILERVKVASQFNRSKIAQLREKSKSSGNIEEAEFYDLLLRPSFYELKGRLELPIRTSKIRQGFGVFRDPRHKIALNHKGIFLSADSDAKVESVAEGQVAFAGELPGYGSVVIVDHGDHYYSVYGHLKNTQVIEGQQLKAKQFLGKVGVESSEFGTGIHFEIRHFSEPQDPQLWVKARDQQQGSLQ